MSSNSSGQGTVIVPVDRLTTFIHQEVGLPSTFFLTIAKAKINADGSLQANYNFSNQSAPPPPQLFAVDEEVTDADAPE